MRALDAGCDCITEKPLTTTPEKAQRILDACKRNNRHVRVLFNYRYSPPRTQVKDLLMSGAIGDVLSVDFHWLLNTLHGADYFRRWHSQKEISGGLMVHKATHHFDLVNWWLGSEPEIVHGLRQARVLHAGDGEAHGARRATTSAASPAPRRTKCTFYLDIGADKNFKELYLDNEKHDGYFRDRCVFRPDINIEDTMNVIVKYKTGATLSYSLNAFNAWEGYTIAFNGTKGRIEHQIVEGGAVSAGATNYQGDGQRRERTRVIPLRGTPQELEVWTGTGGHGGGDTVMLTRGVRHGRAGQVQARRGRAQRPVFDPDRRAANKSFVTGSAVKIAELVTGLTSPDGRADADARRSGADARSRA